MKMDICRMQMELGNTWKASELMIFLNNFGGTYWISDLLARVLDGYRAGANFRKPLVEQTQVLAHSALSYCSTNS